MKKQLTKSKRCPYCLGSLADSHVDHIFPVSKGGLSIESNLVFVCADCNTKKRNLTLRAFAVKFRLDREAIEKRLLKLGKDV
jgi:5-methylcytosine-specific restriction endonuclease McrA